MRARTARTGRANSTAPCLALTSATWLLAAAMAFGQTSTEPAPPPQIAEEVFKNLQVLKGIPVDEFMDTMGMFSAALGYDCASCHDARIGADRGAFAVTTPLMQRARTMVVMVNTLNKTYFAGQPRVSCFTCHRGSQRPEVVPSLALQYGEYMEDPNAMTILPDRRGSVDAVFAAFYTAIGGRDRAAQLKTFVATGTYEGFNTGGGAVPIEIAASAPDRRTQVVRLTAGDGVKTFDGRTAWAAEGWRPLPLMTLTGGNLAGAKLEAVLSFPAGLRAAFAAWQVSLTNLEGREVKVLQGQNPNEQPVNFYFDPAGFLVRVVRWNRTAVGTVPTQVDYSDYREVAGVKMPFRSVVTWTDGQNTIQLNEVRPNVPIEAGRFARPVAYAAKRN
jgi:hypothetical protein